MSLVVYSNSNEVLVGVSEESIRQVYFTKDSGRDIFDYDIESFDKSFDIKIGGFIISK